MMHITTEQASFQLVKFRAGDDQAFSFFYRYFINDMYAYGRSLGGEEAYVMDAVQDVFYKIFFNRPSFQSIEHFRYFLLKSLKNRLLDLFKSKEFSNTTDIDDNLSNFAIKTTVLDHIIAKEDREIIERKIEKLLTILSPAQKEAVYLRYIQELDYAHISDMMGKSESSIRQLVSQAIKKIRKENQILPLVLFIGMLYNKI